MSQSVTAINECMYVSMNVCNEPILRRVVMASVAMDLLESATSPSMSSWHLDTLCVIGQYIQDNGVNVRREKGRRS